MTTHDLAVRLASKVFEARGCHSEIHLSAQELASLLEVAAEATLQIQPTPAVLDLAKEKP